MVEASATGPAKQERLPHTPGQMVIGFTISPEGRSCIGMNIDGEEWILISTMQPPIARSAQNQFKEEFGIDARLGWAFDWRASLNQQKLIPIDGADDRVAQGIYVHPNDYDRLHNMGLSII